MICETFKLLLSYRAQPAVVEDWTLLDVESFVEPAQSSV
jgi:hypothetical protein